MIELVDIRELGALLRVSKTTIYKLIDRGLPTIKVGRCLRFDADDVIAWLKDQE